MINKLPARIILLLICGFLAYAGLMGSGFRQNAKSEFFVGTSPCSRNEKTALGIPLQNPCDRIKWRLTLNYTPAGSPEKFQLEREWGYHIDNRTYKPMSTDRFDGTWKIAKFNKGTSEKETYVLYFTNVKDSLAFRKVSASLIHLLDNNKNLMVGDGGQSYTLNKVPAR